MALRANGGAILNADGAARRVGVSADRNARSIISCVAASSLREIFVRDRRSAAMRPSAAILLAALCGAAALQVPLAPAHRAAAVRTPSIAVSESASTHRAAAVRTPLITMSESETSSRQGLWGTGDAPECC